MAAAVPAPSCQSFRAVLPFFRGHSRCPADPPAAPKAPWLRCLGSVVESVFSPCMVLSARLWSPGPGVRLSLGPGSLPASHGCPGHPPQHMLQKQESVAFPWDWEVLSTMRTPKATRHCWGVGTGTQIQAWKQAAPPDVLCDIKAPENHGLSITSPPLQVETCSAWPCPQRPQG